MNVAITKSTKEKDEVMTQLTKQQMKALATLKTHQRSVITDKEQYITVLSTRLDESNQRVNALDKSISGVLSSLSTIPQSSFSILLSSPPYSLLPLP